MSREQKDLWLWIENTKDKMTNKELQRRQSKILHEMHKRSLENLSFLDDSVKETELLHDGLQMFKAIRLLQRQPYSKLSLNIVILDKHKVFVNCS